MKMDKLNVLVILMTTKAQFKAVIKMEQIFLPSWPVLLQEIMKCPQVMRTRTWVYVLIFHK
jgi:hypothetical protein